MIKISAERIIDTALRLWYGRTFALVVIFIISSFVYRFTKGKQYFANPEKFRAHLVAVSDDSNLVKFRSERGEFTVKLDDVIYPSGDKIAPNCEIKLSNILNSRIVNILSFSNNLELKINKIEEGIAYGIIFVNTDSLSAKLLNEKLVQPRDHKAKLANWCDLLKDQKTFTYTR